MHVVALVASLDRSAVHHHGDAMTGPILLPQDPDIAAALVALVGEIWPLRERYDALNVAGPAAGSSAANNDAERIDRYALEEARTQWVLGSDNLVAWDVIVKAGKQPMNAHATLLRQAMEGAVTARWLIEPGIGQTMRRQRGVRVTRRDLTDRADWERASGTAQKAIPGRARTAQERLAQLEVDAKRAGLAWEDDREIGVTWLFANYYVPHRRYPWKSRSRSLFTFDGTTLYQALSGIAHNRSWAMGAFTERERAGPAPGVTGSENNLVSASSVGSLIFTATAMATLAKALEELESYCGR